MKFNEFIKRYFRVRKCIACREILSFEESESAFCAKCRAKWDSAKTESCSSCGKSAVECTCMPKRLSKAGVLCLSKLVFYKKEKRTEPQNRIIYFVKQNKNKRASEFLAQELSTPIKREFAVLGVDNMSEEVVIVWVPRSVKAKLLYGFDQTEIICKELSKKLSVPYMDLLLRKRGGGEQKKLTRAERIKNTKNRFKINKKLDFPKDKVIVLVDDIVTTGSSMAECATIMKKNGARSVICISIAQD